MQCDNNFERAKFIDVLGIPFRKAWTDGTSLPETFFWFPLSRVFGGSWFDLPYVELSSKRCAIEWDHGRLEKALASCATHHVIMFGVA